MNRILYHFSYSFCLLFMLLRFNRCQLSESITAVWLLFFVSSVSRVPCHMPWLFYLLCLLPIPIYVSCICVFRFRVCFHFCHYVCMLCTQPSSLFLSVLFSANVLNGFNFTGLRGSVSDTDIFRCFEDAFLTSSKFVLLFRSWEGFSLFFSPTAHFLLSMGDLLQYSLFNFLCFYLYLPLSLINHAVNDSSINVTYFC